MSVEGEGGGGRNKEQWGDKQNSISDVHMHVGTRNDFPFLWFYTCDSGCEESIISPPTDVEVLEYSVALSASSVCSSVKTTWR